MGKRPARPKVGLPGFCCFQIAYSFKLQKADKHKLLHREGVVIKKSRNTKSVGNTRPQRASWAASAEKVSPAQESWSHPLFLQAADNLCSLLRLLIMLTIPGFFLFWLLQLPSLMTQVRSSVNFTRECILLLGPSTPTRAQSISFIHECDFYRARNSVWAYWYM